MTYSCKTRASVPALFSQAGVGILDGCNPCRFASATSFPACRPHSERDLFAWSLLAAVILLSLLAMPFFAGGLYTADDLGKFHLPARAFYAEQLAHGESFDWMPDVYSGFYLTGEGQVGTYHPLHRFLYRFLPLHAALGWEYLCSYPLMLAGMYFLLRRRLRRQDAAMVGSLAFTFSSFNLLHFVHPNAVAAVAHIPWLLAMIDIVMVDAKRWKVALAQAFLALLTGSQILLGCPQYVWFSLLAETRFHALAGRDAEVLAARRLRNDAHLPRLHRLPAELVVARDHCQGDRPAGGGGPIAAHAGCPLPKHGAAAAMCPKARRCHPDQPDPTRGPLPAGRSGVRRQCPRTEPLRGGGAVDAGPVGPRSPQRLGLDEAFGPGDGRLCRRGAVAGPGQPGPIRSLCRTRFPWAAWFQFSCRYTVLFQFAVAVLAAIGFVLVEREAREKQKIQRHLPLLDGRGRAAALWRQFEILGATVLISLAVAVAGLILQSGHQVASRARGSSWGPCSWPPPRCW